MNNEEIVAKLTDYLNNEHHFGVEFVKTLTKTIASRPYDEFQCNPIAGDWKHTHLYMDYLIEKFFEENKIPVNVVNHHYIDNTGSDWGTAYHSFLLECDME